MIIISISDTEYCTLHLHTFKTVAYAKELITCTYLLEENSKNIYKCVFTIHQSSSSSSSACSSNSNSGKYRLKSLSKNDCTSLPSLYTSEPC